MRRLALLLLLPWLPACAPAPSSTADAQAHDHAHPDASADADVALEATADAATEAGFDAARSTARDLTVRYTAPAHPDRLSEFALVGEGGGLLARAVLRGNATEEALTLRNALPVGPSRVAWFTDDDGDLAYDAPPTDRAGRLDIPPPPGPHTLTVLPVAPWVDVGASSTEGTLLGRFSEFDVHMGVTFELSLSPEGEDLTVALYRYRSLSGAGAFEFALHGVLQEGRRYVARWFIDLNDNGVYDLRGDHGGELAFDGRARGVTLFHQHHMNRAWVE
ncbi:MAG: hypothetical protein U0324_37765 [Polyangiales bacterium]